MARYKLPKFRELTEKEQKILIRGLVGAFTICGVGALLLKYQENRILEYNNELIKEMINNDENISVIISDNFAYIVDSDELFVTVDEDTKEVLIYTVNGDILNGTDQLRIINKCNNYDEAHKIASNLVGDDAVVDLYHTEEYTR